jgi:hypothetical protein
MQSRNGSKIIGAEAADVLGKFREPRSVKSGHPLRAREELRPDKVLNDAYPFLQSMVEAGYLAVLRMRRTAGDSSPTGTWGAGSTVLDARVVRLSRCRRHRGVVAPRSNGRHQC